jgi:hypothetical protein
MGLAPIEEMAPFFVVENKAGLANSGNPISAK